MLLLGGAVACQMSLSSTFEASTFFGELGFLCIGDVSAEAVYVHWDGFSSSRARWRLLALVLWSEEAGALLYEEGVSFPSFACPSSTLSMGQSHDILGDLVVKVVGAYCTFPFMSWFQGTVARSELEVLGRSAWVSWAHDHVNSSYVQLFVRTCT